MSHQRHEIVETLARLCEWMYEYITNPTKPDLHSSANALYNRLFTSYNLAEETFRKPINVSTAWEARYHPDNIHAAAEEKRNQMERRPGYLPGFIDVVGARHGAPVPPPFVPRHVKLAASVHPPEGKSPYSTSIEIRPLFDSSVAGNIVGVYVDNVLAHRINVSAIRQVDGPPQPKWNGRSIAGSTDSLINWLDPQLPKRLTLAHLPLIPWINKVRLENKLPPIKYEDGKYTQLPLPEELASEQEAKQAAYSAMQQVMDSAERTDVPTEVTHEDLGDFDDEFKDERDEDDSTG